MKQAGDIVVLAKSKRWEFVAKRVGAKWKIYHRIGAGDTPIKKCNLVNVRSRDSLDFAAFYFSIDEAAADFGYRLFGSPLDCSVRDYDFADDNDCPAALVNDLARQAYREAMWRDADSKEEKRLYFYSKRGICAKTRADNVYVWRNEDGSETLIKRVLLDHKTLAGKAYADMPLTENPAWLPLEGPDCIAISDDGSQSECETLAQIQAAAHGEAVPASARQRRTRKYSELRKQFNAQNSEKERPRETTNRLQEGLRESVGTDSQEHRASQP